MDFEIKINFAKSMTLFIDKLFFKTINQKFLPRYLKFLN